MGKKRDSNDETTTARQAGTDDIIHGATGSGSGMYGGIEHVPASIRQEFHDQSLALIKWNGLLTFNFRSSIFFLACLLDVPVLNFLFEIIAMSLLAWYINHRHEMFCKRIAQKM